MFMLRGDPGGGVHVFQLHEHGNEPPERLEYRPGYRTYTGQQLENSGQAQTGQALRKVDSWVGGR